MAVDEAQVLHDMFMTMVHNTPGRVVSIAPEKRMQEGAGDDYSHHELRWRIKDEVVEAFCMTCTEEAQVNG
jgi:hypothetical protein